MTRHRTHQKTEKEESASAFNELILHNDDFNTFDFVIQALVEICKHEPEQAEQCAMIVHYKGKCSIMTGAATELETMCKALNDRGLTASVE